MEPLRILVTGAGGPGAVNLSRSLLSMTPQPFLLAADASPQYVYLALGHRRAVVPRCSSREDYLQAISGLVSEHRIDFVMPNNSLEIAVLSEARERIGARVFLPAPATLALANDKWASQQRFEQAGLPVPRTRLLERPEDVEAAFAELQEGPEAPLWVRGAGIPGRGIGVASLPARTVAQAVQWVEFWRGWGGMIASEYLPGDNLTWMGLYDAGRLVCSQGRRRDAYVIPHVSPSGITGAPALSRTVHDPELNRLGEAATRALDPAFDGVCFVDLKGDAAGQPRITELNAGRFGTTHFFYTAAGANFPEMLLRTAFGEPVDAPARDALPAGLVWIRTLDAGPVLTTEAAIAAGAWPEVAAGSGARWPTVPQNMGDFPVTTPVLWER